MVRDAQIGQADRGTLVLVEQVVAVRVQTMRPVSKLCPTSRDEVKQR